MLFRSRGAPPSGKAPGPPRRRRRGRARPPGRKAFSAPRRRKAPLQAGSPRGRRGGPSLVSPGMAAAAAISGNLDDVRKYQN